jgi:hypothetical protein
MKIQTVNGERYIELETQADLDCIHLIEKAIGEQIEAINPNANWAISAVSDVMDEEGGGVFGYCKNFPF